MDELTRRKTIAAFLGLSESQFIDSQYFECSEQDSIPFVLCYPPGTTLISWDEQVPNSEIAKEILVYIQSGVSVTVPQEIDEHGNALWEFKVMDLKRRTEIAVS